MNNKHLTVVITFRAQLGMEEVAKQEVMALIAPVVTEPGCLNVNFHQDPNDRTRFMLYENWADRDFYTGEHMQTPYLQTYLKKSQDFLVEPPQITFWEILSENTVTVTAPFEY